jgi:hypothetical protein
MYLHSLQCDTNIDVYPGLKLLTAENLQKCPYLKYQLELEHQIHCTVYEMKIRQKKI